MALSPYTIFHLISSDNVEFDAEKAVIEQSDIIKYKLKDFDKNTDQYTIPLPNVSSSVLEKILLYCEHHSGDLPDSPAKKTDKWDEDFIAVDQDMLYELMLAAKHLQIAKLLDLVTSNTMCHLISSDNEQFLVRRGVIEQSDIIRYMLEDFGGNPMQWIPLPNVSSSVLKKVLEYCEHHCYDPPANDTSSISDSGRRRTTEIGEWDQKFITVDQEMLFEIILAANYLQIKPLLNVGCKTVANMIKGKTPEEIRKLFNIVNDFTPEEEAQIKKENEWAEDR